MYDAFYGFREKPFSLLPDPDYLYLSPQHEQALGLLELSLRNLAGFCVISGEIGAGKTTLIRKLLTMTGPEYRVGLVSNTLDSFGELMNWILAAYSLAGGGTPVEQHERFLDFIIREYGRGRRTVLIIDEAQNLGVDALEELRMLSNVNADKHQVLQVILVGQAGLRETLKRPELAQFAQRVLLDFHLAPLGRGDTLHYIRHRLQVAGADPQLFSEDAVAAVFRYSGGLPRIINLLCDTALVYGYAENRATLDAELVHAVARERQASSVPPALRLAAVAPPVTDPVERARDVAVMPAATPEAAGSPPPVPEEPGASVPPPGEPPQAAEVAPATTALPQDPADPRGEGDAEWLRRLADSALPPALREAETGRLEAETEVALEPGLDEQPVRRPPATVAAPGKGTALRRVVAGLALLVAGGLGYWYFLAGDSAPGVAAHIPEGAATPDAPLVPVARPAPPAEEPAREAPSSGPAPVPPVAEESVPAAAPAPARPEPARREATAPPASPRPRATRTPAEPLSPAPPQATRPVPAPVTPPPPAAPAVTLVPPAPAQALAEPVPEPPAFRREALPPEEAVIEVAEPAAVAQQASTPAALAPEVAATEAPSPEPATARSEPAPFTTDPCRGPAARYLSTCR